MDKTTGKIKRFNNAAAEGRALLNSHDLSDLYVDELQYLYDVAKAGEFFDAIALCYRAAFAKGYRAGRRDSK